MPCKKTQSLTRYSDKNSGTLPRKKAKVPTTPCPRPSEGLKSKCPRPHGGLPSDSLVEGRGQILGAKTHIIAKDLLCSRRT